MFKELAALTNLMKNAPEIKRQMEASKQRLAVTTVEGRSTCGQVIVTVTGKMEVTSVRFAADPQVIGSKNGVEILVQEAMNDGLNRAKKLAAGEMSSMASQLGLPADMLEKFGGLAG
ncbi:MAG: YbaB/EbfC family nucleoid-associated protein [Planctomycetaceae bacterium]